METYPVTCPICNEQVGYSESKNAYFEKCPTTGKKTKCTQEDRGLR